MAKGKSPVKDPAPSPGEAEGIACSAAPTLDPGVGERMGQGLVLDPALLAKAVEDTLERIVLPHLCFAVRWYRKSGADEHVENTFFQAKDALAAAALIFRTLVPGGAEVKLTPRLERFIDLAFKALWELKEEFDDVLDMVGYMDIILTALGKKREDVVPWWPREEDKRIWPWKEEEEPLALIDIIPDEEELSFEVREG